MLKFVRAARCLRGVELTQRTCQDGDDRERLGAEKRRGHDAFFHAELPPVSRFAIDGILGPDAVQGDEAHMRQIDAIRAAVGAMHEEQVLCLQVFDPVAGGLGPLRLDEVLMEVETAGARDQQGARDRRPQCGGAQARHGRMFQAAACAAGGVLPSSPAQGSCFEINSANRRMVRTVVGLLKDVGCTSTPHKVPK